MVPQCDNFFTWKKNGNRTMTHGKALPKQEKNAYLVQF